MMCYFLYIEVQFRPEVIERVLRVVRHRGFFLYTLNVLPCGNCGVNNKLHIYLTLLSDRSIDILCEHLKKLVDVSCVIIQSSDNKNFDF